MLAVLLVQLVRTAWLADDAAITLRTVDNFLNGYGLRWNPADRVQTYTHPLWMFCLTGVRLITGEYFYGTLWLCIVVTAGALLVLLGTLARPRGARSLVWLPLAMAALGSKSFMDFSASGLENPMFHLLIALFCVQWWRMNRTRPIAVPPHRAARQLAGLVCIGSLAACTRPDAVVLLGPVVLAACLVPAPKLSWRLRFGAAVVGGLPLLGWLAFSLVYYGTPFPNTAYAKAISASVPRDFILEQGTNYFRYTLWQDPVTFPVIASGLVVALLRVRARVGLPLAASLLVWFGYVLWIGGGFMGGRFFAAPLFLSLCILARSGVLGRPWVAVGFSVLVGVLTFCGPRPPVFAAPGDTVVEGEGNVKDERRFYNARMGMFAPTRDPLTADAFSEVLALNPVDFRLIAVEGAVGYSGLSAGPQVHLVDPWICDPLLVRLPIHPHFEIRPGHYTRRVPEGYFEFLARDESAFLHPDLRDYAIDLRTMTRAPVFSGERWGALWRMWTGAHTEAKQRYVEGPYLAAEPVEVTPAELPPSPPGALPYWQTRGRVLSLGGIRITWPERQDVETTVLEVTSGVPYEVIFEQDGKELARRTIDPPFLHLGTAAKVPVAVPDGARGFDAVLVRRPDDRHHVPALLSVDVRR